MVFFVCHFFLISVSNWMLKGIVQMFSKYKLEVMEKK
jgi:hypothetical protein